MQEKLFSGKVIVVQSQHPLINLGKKTAHHVHSPTKCVQLLEIESARRTIFNNINVLVVCQNRSSNGPNNSNKRY